MLPTAPHLCPKGDAYARPYRSEAERREAFPQWLHTCNHHRGHTALKGQPPAGRVPNLTGQRLSAGDVPAAVTRKVMTWRWTPHALSLWCVRTTARAG